MLDYLKIIRPKNLVLVLLCQLLVYYGIIMPYTDTQHTLELSTPMMWLLMITTAIIAAAGYVINDLIDVETDQINKSSKQWIAKTISTRAGYSWYFFLLFIGSIIALAIAFSIDKPILFIIYPCASFALYLYSKYFKSKILIGNLVVSVFTAGVPFILWYAESDLYFGLDIARRNSFFAKMMAFISFAFLLNMIRELIKDVQDMEGDRSVGLTTYPIAYGLTSSKYLAISYVSITILGAFYLMFWGIYSYMIISLVAVFIILPLLYSIRSILLLRSSAEAKSISTLYKLIMAAGMILLVI